MPEAEASRFLPRYAVGLVAGLILLPGAASVAVVVLTLSADEALTAGQVFLLGTLIGTAAWLALALPLRRMASPQYANSGIYRELVARRHELAGIAATVDQSVDPEAHAVLQASIATVEASLAEDGSDGGGSAWAGGAAYVVVFNFVHRAEQALTKLLPEDAVVQQALYERSALMGSNIANAQEQIDRLERAIHALGGNEYLPQPRTGAAPKDTALARAIVQDAQVTVDDFRDSRRRGLVRARNRLFATVVFTGLVAYAGLGLALLAGAGTTQIVAGGTFYLIGASVGLFRQLRQAAVTDAVTEEDFGLSMVRLVHTPLASGLAAIGGVVLTAYLTALNSAEDVPPLSEVFDISASPLGLVSAAVFGFTPSLIAASLQSRADKWKEELKSSAPGEKTES
ncbi:MAG TPA: hypothetical protein VD769_12875 [Gaiellaceae bacterium]|nr:hypothetical protein [Gaiellaceae bacterium]